MEATIPLGHYQDAVASAVRALKSARAQGATADIAAALVVLSVARLELGELEAAVAVAEEAIATCDQVGYARGRLVALATLALGYAQLGRPAEALSPLTRFDADAQLASPEVVVAAAPTAVAAWTALGRLDHALALAQEALFLHRALELPVQRASLEAAMAEVQVNRAAWEMAHDFAVAAERVAKEREVKGVLLRTRRTLARSALRARKLDEAKLAAEQALALAIEDGAVVQAALCAGMLGEVLRAQGDPGALAQYQAMQALADRAGSVTLRALALGGQVRVAPAAPGAAERRQEARRLLDTMASTLSREDAARFLALPDHADVMALEAPGAVTGPHFSDRHAMFDLLDRADRDLQAVTAQYGQLFKEWIAKSQRLGHLNQLADALNASLDLADVLERVMRLTMEVTRSERAFVLLVEPGEAGGLAVQAGRDAQGRDVRYGRYANSVCQKVFATGEPTTILDARGSAANTTQSIQALDLQTVMCVPLGCRNRRLGVLYVDSQAAVKTFAADDLALLGAIANHAAVAIDNALMYERLHAHTSELESTLARASAAEQQASTDALTGLRNRRFLMETIQRELDVARRYGRDLAVVMVDVDHFKRFNDDHGHAVGDEVLRTVAGVLATQARSGDLPTRLGGEEFLVLCPSTSPDDAAILAERLRVAIAHTALTNASGKDIPPLSASFGIASYRQGAHTLDELLKFSDQALYAAKAAGRNTVKIWAPAAKPG